MNSEQWREFSGFQVFRFSSCRAPDRIAGVPACTSDGVSDEVAKAVAYFWRNRFLFHTTGAPKSEQSQPIMSIPAAISPQLRQLENPKTWKLPSLFASICGSSSKPNRKSYIVDRTLIKAPVCELCNKILLTRMGDEISVTVTGILT